VHESHLPYLINKKFKYFLLLIWFEEKQNEKSILSSTNNLCTIQKKYKSGKIYGIRRFKGRCRIGDIGLF
jgi:hypothetical protein